MMAAYHPRATASTTRQWWARPGGRELDLDGVPPAALAPELRGRPRRLVLPT